ncbi:STAS domain-containing protein [Actinoplanes sp. NPDC051343]|uniref:STAS domain-containing protein n=1 Tax=Actinoplanes sp. NPDC051343 TaxID=3363906 RepID=UPI00378B162C
MTTLHPRGEVDMATMAAFERTLESGLGTDRDLVVDLSELTFIDAAGLRALAAAACRVRQDGRRLTLARPNRNLGRLLRLVGLGDLIV